MNPIITNRQTIITSWVLAFFRWCSVAGYIYFSVLAEEHFNYKSGMGNLEKAEPLTQIANTFFWCWASLILAAVIIAFISPKIERSMLILFQIVVLPSLEFWFVFFYGI